MTHWQRIALGIGVLLVAALLFSLYGAMQANAEMRVTLKLEGERFERQAKVIEDQTKAIQNLQDRMAQREIETNRTIAMLSAQQANIARQTPQQNLQQLPQVSPINPIPTNDGEALLSKQDIAKLLEFSLECKKCQVSLESEKANNADLKQTIQAKDTQLTAKDEQIASVEKQRDAAVKAAKGGSFWQRFKKGSKWFLVGVAAGAALVIAH